MPTAPVATATFDKPSYNKGDLVTLTVTDPARQVTTPLTVPTTSGPLTLSLVVNSPAGVPTATGYTFTQKSDNTTTGVSVWTTTA